MVMKWPFSHRSPGAEVRVQLLASAFDPWQSLADYEIELTARLGAGQYGACCSFVGTMRDFNLDTTVSGMTLEHYPAMTQKVLETLCQEAEQAYDVIDTLIIHRYGTLLPSDPIVLVASWSAHRNASFEASRFLIEALKSRAPFWKKEALASVESARWVEKNTDG